MPKVMIEIDLPEGQKIPTADDIKRLTNPDWLAEWWHIDDVRGSDPTKDDDWNSDLTDDECREVLRRVNKYHDCEEGINWSVLEWHIEKLKSERKEVA